MPNKPVVPIDSKSRNSRRNPIDGHDELNREIIALLQEDGRKPYSVIAAQLDVSEGAVRKRVNKLQQSGAIKVIAVLDPLEQEHDDYTMLGIKVSTQFQPESVAARLSLRPEVVYAIWVSGPYDLLVEVVFEEKKYYLEFMTEEIFGHTDIVTCDVMNNLKVIKNQYFLKPDIRK